MKRDFDRIGGESEAPDALRLRVPPKPRYSKAVRDAVLAYALACGVARRALEDVMFAVGEALANAIEHAGSGDVIDVQCHYDGEKLLATIVDSGPGFAAEGALNANLPEDLSERGRGIGIMQSCTDILSIQSIPGRGTEVVIGKYVAPHPEESTIGS
jgi:anti-sigma regulatory factor (Ser/Thr protein kinase)